ncbi:MAG: hypothetical protein Kow0090_05090 [Myxococcota bacterium]
MKRIFISALVLFFVLPPAIAAGESDRDMSVEFKAGPIYFDKIDSEPSLEGNTPFKDVFDSDNRLFVQGEFNYQFFQNFGSLSALLGAGYTRFKGKSFFELANDNSQEEDEGSQALEQSSDETTFMAIPIFIGAAYRFDVIYRGFKIPLVPYLKGGGEYILWWSLNGSGNTSESELGGKGRGGRKGFFFRPGAQLALNWLDPDAGKHFDLSSGINESYFFVEYSIDEVNDFSNDGLNLSYRTWFLGLMFEF